jgi:hypothetical protein
LLNSTLNILLETWRVFLEAAPYVVLGLAAAVLLYAFFPKKKIEEHLGRRGLGSIIKASLLGIPLPLCSCGVLPTAMSLRARGASRGATVSFLVSTPETGVDSIAVTYALINPAMTILRPVSAFLSAAVAGLAVDKWGGWDAGVRNGHETDCQVCGDHDCETEHKWTTRLRGSLRYIANDFFPDIANWLLLGLIISGVVAALLPADFLTGVPGSAQLFLAVAAGVPIYICASASTPIAAALMAKGVSPGAALVFLLVGPATNLASLLVVGRRLGKRTAVIYLLSLVVVALAIGWLVNTIMGGWNWVPRIANPELHEHYTMFNWVGAGILLLGFLYTWWRQVRPPRNRVVMGTHGRAWTGMDEHGRARTHVR